MKDDDSDGDGHEWLRPQDPCSEDELVLRRRKHLERLQQLYELQYYQLQRVLEKKYTVYVETRQTSATATADGVQIIGPGASARNPSKVPLNKRKLGETSTLPHDDHDMGSTHQHRYNRLSGHVAALTLQRLRRMETGYSYPYAVPSAGGPGGSRLRCSMQATHLPPCYNCSLPYARYCRDHILNDPAQVLFVPCKPTNGTVCTSAVPRFLQPPVCEKCVTVDDFVRNPRLTQKPPKREPTELPLDVTTMAGLGGADMAGITGDLDLDGLEALVGGDAGMPSIDELAGLRIDGVGLIDGGQLQADETQMAVAELSSALASEVSAGGGRTITFEDIAGPASVSGSVELTTTSEGIAAAGAATAADGRVRGSAADTSIDDPVAFGDASLGESGDTTMDESVGGLLSTINPIIDEVQGESAADEIGRLEATVSDTLGEVSPAEQPSRATADDAIQPATSEIDPTPASYVEQADDGAQATQ